MKLSATSGTRLAWSDRSLVQIAKFSNGDRAPHAETTRWTYTVPLNKNSLLTTLELQLQRSVVAGVVGIVQMICYYTPLGQAQVHLFYVRLDSNSVGDAQRITLSPQLHLGPQDLIYVTSQDASTAGTVNVMTSASFLEYTQ